MRMTKSARSSRRLIVSTLVAISLMLVLTAAVSASSQGAKWNGIGQVIFAGPSQDPALPTTTQSEFKFKRNGDIRSVEINTFNELFVGVLGDGAGGSAFTSCNDRKHSTACEDLEILLTGAQVTSLHNSKAKLNKITQGTMPFPGIGEIPVLSGQVRGKIDGVFTISDAEGSASGTSSLRILKGSTATYACFGPSASGPIPTTTLEPCTENTGGMLLPIFLEVHDKGSFEIGQGIGSMSDILGIKGKVEVKVISNPLMQEFGGSIIIKNAKTTVAVEEEPEVEDEDEEEDKRKKKHGDDDGEDA